MITIHQKENGKYIIVMEKIRHNIKCLWFMIIGHLFGAKELLKIIIDSNHISRQAYEISSNLVRPGGGI